MLPRQFHSTPYQQTGFAGGKVGWQGSTKSAKTLFRKPVSGWHNANTSPCSAFELHNYSMFRKIWAVQAGRCPIMPCYRTHTQLGLTYKCHESQTVPTWAWQKNAAAKRAAAKWKRTRFIWTSNERPESH